MFLFIQVTDSYKQSKETVKNLLEVTSIVELETFGIFNRLKIYFNLGENSLGFGHRTIQVRQLSTFIRK